MLTCRLLGALAALTALGACYGGGGGVPRLDQPDWQANRSTPANAVGVQRMIEATQNWTDQLRADFWHKDQGSLMAPLDIATKIERHDSRSLMLSDESIVTYRYVPQNTGGKNPMGLPLGFTVSEWDGDSYLGLTCAACHSTMMTYKGTGLMLDGAPSQGDFQSFFDDMTDAFRVTTTDQTKFDRLADRMEKETQAERSALRQRLILAADKMEARRKMNETEVAYGFGRVDAVGEIFNSVAAQNLGIPGNRADPNAPVNYPHVWGTHQSNLVQWNGFAPNVTKFNNIRILGPLVRNAGEVIGVFGTVEVPGADTYKPGDRYRNSIRQRNLMRIEQWLEQLAPPPWPTDVLGPIDAAKAARGKEVYNDKVNAQCAACHQVLDDPFQCYNATMVLQSKVGTDPGQAKNALRSAKVGFTKGRTIRRSE